MNYFDYYINDETETLTEEEFRYYFAKYKNGDLQARDILIKHNIRLVLSVVKSYNVDIFEKNDLVQIGCMGMMKALEHFDISKGFKFSAYAGPSIRNEINMYLRKQNNTTDVSIYEVFYTKAGDSGLTIENTLYDEDIDIELDYEDDLALSSIRALINNLPERDSRIMQLYYGFYDGNCYSQKQIADIIGITQSVVSRTITKNCEILKSQIIELELVDDIKDRSKNKRYKYTSK